jgi:hypothetical protein
VIPLERSFHSTEAMSPLKYCLVLSRKVLSQF